MESPLAVFLATRKKEYNNYNGIPVASAKRLEIQYDRYERLRAALLEDSTPKNHHLAAKFKVSQRTVRRIRFETLGVYC